MLRVDNICNEIKTRSTASTSRANTTSNISIATTTTLSTLSTTTRSLDRCEQKPCGKNSQCISTISSYYCRCNAGFFGDPGNECLSDTGTSRQQVAQSLSLQLTFIKELLQNRSEEFRLYKLAFEGLLEPVLQKSPGYINKSIQVTSFRSDYFIFRDHICIFLL